ncbi:MAG TPA: CPBP family intramembrane glutamic endopeptidase, partial [Candidatus Xenobia bacterium]
EVLIVVMNLGHGNGIVNGADAVLLSSLALLGVTGRVAAEASIAALAVVLVCRKDKMRRIRPGYLAGMGVESLIYAVLFGAVVARLVVLFLPGFVLGLETGGLNAAGVGLQFVMCMGAGVFEELLFRVLIMGGLTWAGMRWFKMKRGGALFLGALVSSLLFSAFHYIGSFAYGFTVASFAYRFFAGMLLAFIYRTRGFGIAATTHALYDVLVTLQGLV